jgi:hypothetical protein
MVSPKQVSGQTTEREGAGREAWAIALMIPPRSIQCHEEGMCRHRGRELHEVLLPPA